MSKHTIRWQGDTREIEPTPLRCIKFMCSECMGWETHPKDCKDALCPLFPYRGKAKRLIGDSEMALLREKGKKLAKNLQRTQAV